MNWCSILAVCLYNVANYVTQKGKCTWDKVTDAEWIKQTIGIKDDTSFFEKVIDIKSWSLQSSRLLYIRGKKNTWFGIVVPCHSNVYVRTGINADQQSLM